MSAPWSEPPATPHGPGEADPATATAPLTPRGLLAQMQELLASVSTDLAGMGAALQSSAAAGPPRSEPTAERTAEPTAEATDAP